MNSQGRQRSKGVPYWQHYYHASRKVLLRYKLWLTCIIEKYLRYLSCFSISIHQAHRQKRAYSTRAAVTEALQILYPPSSSSQKDFYGGGPWSASTSHGPPHDTFRSISLPRAKQGPATPSKIRIRLHQPAQIPWAKSMEDEPV